MRKWKDEGDGEGHENTERWLLTYSDMITLLLALFIMLYSISNVDAAKFKALAENMNAIFNNGQTVSLDTSNESGGTDYVISASSTPTALITSLQNPSASASASASASDQNNGNVKMDETSQQVLEKLNALILQNGLQASVSVHLEERGVVVRLEEGLLFPSGSADINSTANDSMNKIAQIILSTKNYIRVEGSTDNVPISTSQFKSNWDLSCRRAANVVELLITDGVEPTRISITGYGEQRPVAPNDTEANKQQNRRVDIVFLNQNLNASEAGAVTPAPSAQK